MIELSLMDLVLATMGVLVTMALICCLCCISMKFSDMRMKCYIIETAKKRGIRVDPNELDPKHGSRSPLANENCTIMVPEKVTLWASNKGYIPVGSQGGLQVENEVVY